MTGQLWQLVVVHAELPAHLAALKNYFLLAKGDFYHSFLAEVWHMQQAGETRCATQVYMLLACFVPACQSGS